MRVERIDQPEAGLLSLTVHEDRKKQVLLLSTLPDALGVGLVAERPRGQPASQAITKLRRHLEGTAIVGIRKSNRFIVLELLHRGATRRLIVTPRKPDGGWWLEDAEGAVLVQSSGAHPGALDEGKHLRALDDTALRSMGPSLVALHRTARAGRASRRLDRIGKRLTRKRQAIEADLARARRVDELHEQAAMILAHASEIPLNSGSFEVQSWDDPTRTVRLELDPHKTAPEMAEALFKRAKRMRRGLDVAPERLALVDDELREISTLRRQLDAGEVDAVFAALEKHGDEPSPPPASSTPSRRSEGRSPYRQFHTVEGNAILVGRNATDNDRLTLRVARPHDLWLHARGVTGAHVVVPLDKGKACSSETLVDAATLAAHFSELRGEHTVDVLYTPRRFVHKRKGTGVGTVTLDREKVIPVRLQVERLKRLLASERRLQARTPR